MSLLLPSSSSPPLSRPLSSLLHSYSSPLLRRFPPCHPSGSCGRSPRPARPFPQPRPPISPVRTKMLAIGQAGLRHAGGGRHKPPPVLAPAPTVSPSAFSAGIAALARSIRQDRGGSGRVTGATAAPLDQLAYLSARRTTYRRTYTNPLRRIFSVPFFALPMNRLPSSNSTC